MAPWDDMSRLDWHPRAATTLVLAFAGPFLFTWIISSWRSWRAMAAAAKAAPGDKRPPTLPSTVPLAGHVIQFMRDGHRFCSTAVKHFGRDIPVRVNLATFPTCIVSGPESVAAFLKDPTRGLTQTSRSLKIMENAFGCPPEFVDEFRPHADSAIENELHHALQSMLSGPNLEIMYKQFQDVMVSQVLEGEGRMGDDWTVLPDLCSFVEKNVFEAATRALYGPYVVELSPTITADFREFNRYVRSLFMGVPHWLNPAARRARDQMVQNIKRWQRHAQAHCSIDDIPDDVEWEPYYGSRTTRNRQKFLTKRGIMDESARAAENLAFLFVTNVNSVPAACWFLLETLHDPSLQPRVRARLQAASIPAIHTPEKGKHPKPHLAFDIIKLTEDDLLQSMYAETLRLRVSVLLVRQPARDNFSLHGWHIKKHEAVSMSTSTEMMDQDVWNTGSKSDPHPIDRFWAERFLVHPNDPRSGPLKENKRRETKSSNRNGAPYFSLDGCAFSWIPYGGGRNLCPGRHFAKREIMLTAAILLAAYDIELLTDKMPGPDKRVFGFGTLPPNAKVPCRIRRRQT